METVTGYVDHIIYRNAENGYTVLKLGGDEEMTCVGVFPYVSEGEMLELCGEIITHNTYGEQLKVTSYEVKDPEDIISIERYLGSGAIKGIGVALAGRIVRRFKGETFRIIEEEPERLAEIKGISERKAQEIAEQIEDKKDMRQAMIYLQKYGVTLNLAAKIYEHYGNSVYRVMEENPYQMADHVPGVGFKTADEIASRIGIHTDSDFRIRSGIFYALMQSVNDGHVYLLKETLLLKSSELLEVNIEDIESYLLDLSMEKKIIVKIVNEQTRVFPAHFYYLELNAAKMLHDLNLKYDVSDTAVEQEILKITKKNNLELDECQQRAVKEAVKNGVMILTGGPGTGKTTTINTMIQYFEEERMEIMLAAPTGRAAKRMTEATGHEARTIHRMLEVSGNPENTIGNSGFGRNEENPLEADVVIIDEMSMVDITLMNALLKAIVPGTRLILVGDGNQLPSVGAGDVLNDMISSQCFATVLLNKIFRQAKESDIVVNAHKIHNGEPIVFDNKSRDFFLLKRQDANTIISVMLTLIQKKLPNYVGATSYDIQVLTPMRKGLLGVERLNQILQQYLNPEDKKKAEKEYGERIFREGDKVMQTKNNYQLEWEITTKYGMTIDRGMGVFNGDMGIIKSINHYTETIEIEYDEGKKVEYPFQLLEELELAYAITIHKSQGSEYPAVVIPLLQGPRQLYHRNLIYTAVTRARQCVTVVGSDTVFQEMVDNDVEQQRNTSLDEQIRECQE